jgi:hypothetical protein
VIPVRQSADRSTYVMSFACIAVLAASVSLPRMVKDASGGFAAATSAALIFFVIGAVGSLAALALLVRTIRCRSTLSLPARVAGILPAAIVVLGTMALWLVVRRA